jgi:hypothetical protein
LRIAIEAGGKQKIERRLDRAGACSLSELEPLSARRGRYDLAVIGDDEVASETIRHAGVGGMAERLFGAPMRRTVHVANLGPMSMFAAAEFEQGRNDFRPNAPLLATNFRVSRQHGDLPSLR